MSSCRGLSNEARKIRAILGYIARNAGKVAVPMMFSTFEKKRAHHELFVGSLCSQIFRCFSFYRGALFVTAHIKHTISPKTLNDERYAFKMQMPYAKSPH